MYDVAHYSCCGYEYPEPISEVAPSENYCPQLRGEGGERMTATDELRRADAGVKK